jgi:hypothetical protein
VVAGSLNAVTKPLILATANGFGDAFDYTSLNRFVIDLVRIVLQAFSATSKILPSAETSCEPDVVKGMDSL